MRSRLSSRRRATAGESQRRIGRMSTVSQDWTGERVEVGGTSVQILRGAPVIPYSYFTVRWDTPGG